MPFEHLTAISSIDGRYRAVTAPLAEYFSEYALIRARVRVECEYLIALSETPEIGMRELTDEEKVLVRRFAENFSLDDARAVKEHEKTTNHDVKAVEYFLKSKIAGTSLEDAREWIHFALTSEDVNSVAYGILLSHALREIILPSLDSISATLDQMAREHADTAMLARTHGQSASPTTFGKEMRVFERRLARQMDELRTRTILVKFGGATGNWNAHVIAAPDVDWQAFASNFIHRIDRIEKMRADARRGEGDDGGVLESTLTEEQGPRNEADVRILLNPTTTQIEPHDTYAELFDNLRRINTILIGFSQDMWRYISDGWITQKPKEGEIGSSAMPHKINPIDFENAEGNFGLANALFEHFSRKLPISRLQRDLSDSTVERTFGTAFAHSLIGCVSLVRGLGKIKVNADTMLENLQRHPEVLAEAVQTVLRAEGVDGAYEQLKELTRGKELTLDNLRASIASLAISESAKQRLLALTPETYIGLAPQIAHKDSHSVEI